MDDLLLLQLFVAGSFLQNEFLRRVEIVVELLKVLFDSRYCFPSHQQVFEVDIFEHPRF